MQYRIANGSLVDIEVGNKVCINPDYLPQGLTGEDQLSVTQVTTDYPYVHFFKEETYLDEDGISHSSVKVDETSAVSPILITEVIT